MKSIKVSSEGLAKRNMCTSSGGQLASRPGLRRQLAASAFLPSTQFTGAQTVVDGRTGDVMHIIAMAATTAPYGAFLVAFDASLTAYASLTTNVNALPRALSVAPVLSQVLIASPDLPTCWAVLASSMSIAVKQTSVNASLTPLEVPDNCITVAWQNRAVLAQGNTLFISDPVTLTGGSPQTFLAVNQQARPGAIFGLHVGAGGQLVCCTTAGVFALEAGAAASGAVIGDWRLLSHHQTVAHETTCAIDGRIYGLTSLGYRLIDIEDSAEVELDDPYMTRAVGTRISVSDYRSCRMFPGPTGPLIYSPEARALFVVERTGGVSSWWTCAPVDTAFDVRGVLQDTDGSTLLVCTDGIFSMAGNFDGDLALTSAYGVQPTALLHGTVETSPSENQTVRALRWAAAGATSMAIRGDLQTDAAYVDSVTGPVVGTSSFGGTWRYMTSPAVAHRCQFDVNCNDLAIEVAVDGADCRAGTTVVVELSGQGDERPQDRG